MFRRPAFLLVLIIIFALTSKLVKGDTAPDFIGIISEWEQTLPSSLAGKLQTMPKCEGSQGYINYTTVTGFFLQDEPDTNVTTFDFVSWDFRYVYIGMFINWFYVHCRIFLSCRQCLWWHWCFRISYKNPLPIFTSRIMLIVKDDNEFRLD